MHNQGGALKNYSNPKGDRTWKSYANRREITYPCYNFWGSDDVILCLSIVYRTVHEKDPYFRLGLWVVTEVGGHSVDARPTAALCAARVCVEEGAPTSTAPFLLPSAFFAIVFSLRHRPLGTCHLFGVLVAMTCQVRKTMMIIIILFKAIFSDHNCAQLMPYNCMPKRVTSFCLD